MKRFFFGAALILLLALGAPLKAFDSGVSFSVATGMGRRLFSLFIEESFGRSKDHTFYALSYHTPALLGSLPLRSTFTAYLNDHPIKEYRSFGVGWLPAVILHTDPVYFTAGLGPFIKNRKTVAQGGYFALNMQAGIGISMTPVAIEFFVRHISNCYTARPNKAGDLIGVSIGVGI